MKILSLTTKHFNTGVALSVHDENSGVFSDPTIGIYPFVDAQSDSVQSGLLQTTSSPSELGAGIVADNWIAHATQVTGSNVGTLYGLGNLGHLYTVGLITGTVTDKRSGTLITDPANGLAIYQPSGANQYLYYFQKTQIGRWDLSGNYPTGWTDNWATGLTSTSYHPTHVLYDELYYGNKSTVGKLSGSTPTNSTNVLDLPTDYLITTLSDDGQYLVIGATKNLGDDNLVASTKILFWDLQSTSWNKEYDLPDANIVSIKKEGTVLYAVCSRGIYVFNYITPPQLLLPISSGNNRVPFTSGTGSGNFPGAVDINKGQLYWGSSQRINVFGKATPASPRAFFQPYKLINDNFPSWLTAQAVIGRIYFTENNKLYLQSTTSGGGTSETANTVYFKPEKPVCVSEIELVFGEPLTLGDSINVDIQSDEDTSAVDVGTASFATHGSVRKIRLPLVNAFNPADKFKLILNFDGGNVKIKEINVYGDYLNA